MESKITFGQWLKNKRESLGLSQQELSDLTSGLISKPYVSLLENDRTHGKSKSTTEPALEKLKALAIALRCSFAEVLAAIGYPVDDKPIIERELSP